MLGSIEPDVHTAAPIRAERGDSRGNRYGIRPDAGPFFRVACDEHRIFRISRGLRN